MQRRTVISCYLDAATVDELDLECERQERSRSQLMAMFIRSKLASLKTGPNQSDCIAGGTSDVQQG